MEADYEMLRGERRSIFIPNKLWQELLKQTDDCISISTYVKLAIVDRMIKDEPEKEEYFKSLLLLEN